MLLVDSFPFCLVCVRFGLVALFVLGLWFFRFFGVFLSCGVLGVCFGLYVARTHMHLSKLWY